MYLDQKIALITPQDAVAQIGEMISSAHVSINGYAQRVVTIDGYQGSVTIDQLAAKFLLSSALQWKQDPTLQERWSCYTLWDRIRKLYIDSDEELRKDSLYENLSSVKEFGSSFFPQWFGNERATICDTKNKEVLYMFTQKQYGQLWVYPDNPILPIGVLTLTEQEFKTAVEKATIRL